MGVGFHGYLSIHTSNIIGLSCVLDTPNIISVDVWLRNISYVKWQDVIRNKATHQTQASVGLMLGQRRRRLANINPFSAGIDFRRQNLTSKVDPRTERVIYFNGP